MASLDSVLNVMVPVIIVIVFGYLLYKPLAPALSGLGRFIARIFGGIKRKAAGEEEIGDLDYE